RGRRHSRRPGVALVRVRPRGRAGAGAGPAQPGGARLGPAPLRRRAARRHERRARALARGRHPRADPVALDPLPVPARGRGPRPMSTASAPRLTLVVCLAATACSLNPITRRPEIVLVSRAKQRDRGDASGAPRALTGLGAAVTGIVSPTLSGVVGGIGGLGGALVVAAYIGGKQHAADRLGQEFEAVAGWIVALGGEALAQLFDRA